MRAITMTTILISTPLLPRLHKNLTATVAVMGMQSNLLSKRSPMATDMAMGILNHKKKRSLCTGMDILSQRRKRSMGMDILN